MVNALLTSKQPASDVYPALTMIPAESAWQIRRIHEARWEWNHGHFGNPDLFHAAQPHALAAGREQCVAFMQRTDHEMMHIGREDQCDRQHGEKCSDDLAMAG